LAAWLDEQLKAIEADWDSRASDAEESARRHQLAAFPPLSGQLFIHYFADKLVARYVPGLRLPTAPLPTDTGGQPRNPFHEHDGGLDPHDWEFQFRVGQRDLSLSSCANKVVVLATSAKTAEPLDRRELKENELVAGRALVVFLSLIRGALSDYVM
jgi:hypothetical protein